MLARVVIQRMGDISEGPVPTTFAGHGDKETVRSLNDLDVRNYETVIENNYRKNDD